jgi:hypothetical protein
MSDEFNTTERVVKEFLIDLMIERFMSMSIGVQASSTRGMEASPSTSRGARPSQPSAEKRTKHRNDLANVKLIPSIFPNYILPLADTVNHDSVPRDFEYSMVTVYLPKGICIVQANQDKITTLNFNDFNLEDRKIYGMLAPYNLLTRTKGKNSKIIPQSWTMNLTQSALLNFMKIPHFRRHQEFNAYIKMLLSCYHGGYLWLDCLFIVDPMLIHRITGLSMQGPNL